MPPGNADPIGWVHHRQVEKLVRELPHGLHAVPAKRLCCHSTPQSPKRSPSGSVDTVGAAMGTTRAHRAEMVSPISRAQDRHWLKYLSSTRPQKATAAAEMYQAAIQNPEKAVYWKLTIEFGRMFERMYRQWCQVCIRELEELRQKQTDEVKERSI